MRRTLTIGFMTLAIMLGGFSMPAGQPISFVQHAEAHPGNTDKYGCHTCKTNCPKWGLRKAEYHCHKSKGLVQPKAAIKSKKIR